MQRRFSDVSPDLPGPKATALMKSEYEFFTPSQDRIYPLYTSRMSGLSVEDVDGNRFLDLSSGCGAVPLGYSHPEVVEAGREALSSYAHTGFPHANETTVR